VRTILLVGNESEELLLFAETLTRYDYSVITSSEDLSGISGTCKDSHIDLVIADCRMPGRDGVRRLSALRQGLPAIPVILLTSRQFKADGLTAKKLGANTYIVKQAKASNLERIVTAILTGNRSSGFLRQA
jgi:CheY-like chemotaxis protein